MPEKSCHADEKSGPQVVLTEGAILGGGAFSRVSIVSGQPPSPPLEESPPHMAPYRLTGADALLVLIAMDPGRHRNFVEMMCSI